MITSSHARAMAEAKWGKGGTTGYRTNRAGAFYYSCSGHGGFVIDARCLTPEERTRIEKYLAPQSATEIFDYSTDKVCKFRGPDSYRNLRYTPYSQGHREVDIFFAEEDQDWCIPAALAGILTSEITQTKARESFIRSFKPTNHDLLTLGFSAVAG